MGISPHNLMKLKISVPIIVTTKPSLMLRTKFWFNSIDNIRKAIGRNFDNSYDPIGQRTYLNLLCLILFNSSTTLSSPSLYSIVNKMKLKQYRRSVNLALLIYYLLLGLEKYNTLPYNPSK